MNLKSLLLSNFRRFKGQHFIRFSKDVTVFAANNGAGKTSVLDAIALAFGAFLSRLPKVVSNALSDRDISLPHKPDELFSFIVAAARVDSAGDLHAHPDDGSISWHRIKVYEGTRKSRDLAKEVANELAPKGIGPINAFADYLVGNVATTVVFPVLAYYGTGRAILDIPQRRRGFGKEFPRPSRHPAFGRSLRMGRSRSPHAKLTEPKANASLKS